jgi:RNA polymerase sigma-70 factor (ECF subfamily)
MGDTERAPRVDGRVDFADIYREFQPRIHRYLCRLSGEADAADLTQSVFLKVSRSLADFRGDASLSTWIHRIATNTARDHAEYRASKRRGSERPFDDPASIDEMPDAGIPGNEGEYARREMSACVRGLVDRLPEPYRVVLVLGELEEMTNPEIAEALGVSLDAVKIRRHRARAALRKAMGSRCSLSHDERNELVCDRKEPSGCRA